MFPDRFFPARYFPNRYWPIGSGDVPPEPTIDEMQFYSPRIPRVREFYLLNDEDEELALLMLITAIENNRLRQADS